MLEAGKLSRAISGTDYIFHLAASVPFSQHCSYSEDMAKKDLEIIDAIVKSAIQLKIKKIIFISGFVIYGQVHEIPLKESSPTKPTTVYGKSKLMCENHLKSSCLENKISYVILRASSCYGPYQYAKGLIPNFINSALNDRDIFIENKDVKRDYVFIDDLIDAFVLSIMAENKIYNIGGGKSYSVQEVANSITHIIKKGNIVIQNKPPPELTDNVLDISLAKKELGFSPKTSLTSGLKIQIDWKINGGKKRIYFDLDGTLIDPYKRLYILHKNILEKFGVKTPLNKDQYMLLKKEKISEEQIISSLLPKDKINSYIKQRRNLIESSEYLSYDKLIPGVYEFLKKLSKNFNLVLLTKRKYRKNLLNQLKLLKLQTFFSQIFQASQKNSKSFLLKQKYNKSSIIIGDTEEDDAAGKDNNIPAILVEWGLRSKKYVKQIKPYKIARNLPELEKFIEEWDREK